MLSKEKKSKSVKRKSDLGFDVINENTKFSITEAYKEIRANLSFAVAKNGSKVIMLTSAISGEGKTTTSVNLAITLAQTDASVLIIDADLRKPRVSTLLNISTEVGLSNCLSGMVSLDEAVVETQYNKLLVLPAGKIPPNPGELLTNSRMQDIIENVRTVFDYVIIDTTPVCIVSDALPVSKLCDGVIMITRQNYSSYKSMDEAVMKLKFADANILGIVLNGAENKRKNYGYRNKRYGKNYYGSYNSYGNK